MSKTIIKTTTAPAPIGPYNQAILTGNLLFISGQICIDPATGELKNKDIQEETHQVMHNLKAILQEAGLDLVRLMPCMENTLKVTFPPGKRCRYQPSPSL